jgi:hypothetical protein
MTFKNLNHFSTSSIKALFGLHPIVLADVLFQVLPALDQRRRQRLATRPDRKRPVVAHDGRPPEVHPYQRVLMALLYLRHHVSQAVVGALFGVSADTSENAFHEVVPLLRDLFPHEKWEAERRLGRGDGAWTPDAVERAIIDSFETPVNRPSQRDRQKRVSSGKKKQHTLKTQIIADQTGAILCISPAHRGPQADLKVYEEEGVPDPIKDKPKLGDKAYADRDHPEIQTPHKKPRGGELTPDQKAENKLLAAKRIPVEHAIRRVKGWNIVRGQYRLALGLFSMVSSAVVGLIQFSRILQ